MMITTIQLGENVKNELERLKENRGDTYEKVIVSLIKLAEERKREQTALLAEGYKEMAEESLKIAKEFDAIEEDFDWEWK